LQIIAARAQQTWWNTFYNDVLLSAAKQGKFHIKPEWKLLKTYFNGLDVEEFTGLAKLNDVTVTGSNNGKIYDDLSCGTLTWSKVSNLGRIASSALPKLWSNFYDNVLLPAAEQGKLRIQPERTLLKTYFTALDSNEFTELAKLNGVTVTGTNDGKIWDDLSGATLTWRYANKSVIGTGMPCHSKEWSHGSRVVSWEQ